MKRKCHKGEDEICDFCIHFNMFKNKNGFNIDGSGPCGFNGKVEIVDVGDGCNNFYCKQEWGKNLRKLFSKHAVKKNKRYRLTEGKTRTNIKPNKKNKYPVRPPSGPKKKR